MLAVSRRGLRTGERRNMSITSSEILSVPVSDKQRAKRFYQDVLGF
jgi:predicted enzyme related to lactoylglutathione lyase